MGGVVAGFILYTIYSYKPYTQSLPWEGLLQVLYILKALCIVFLYQSNDALRFANPVLLRNSIGGGAEVQQGGTVDNEGRDVRSKHIAIE